MTGKVAHPRRGKHRPLMVAMVLGTALTALAPSPIVASEVKAATNQAVVDMSRYCTACWRNARLHPDSWIDCTQEVFQRMLERVRLEAWSQVLDGDGEERKEFLRAIDAVKKRCQRMRKMTPGLIEQAADVRQAHEKNRTEDWEIVWTAAEEVLTPRQQRILRMSYEGWAVQEIADELGVGPERVSDEKYKAIRRLRDHLHDASEV